MKRLLLFLLLSDCTSSTFVLKEGDLGPYAGVTRTQIGDGWIKIDREMLGDREALREVLCHEIGHALHLTHAQMGRERFTPTPALGRLVRREATITIEEGAPWAYRDALRLAARQWNEAAGWECVFIR